MSAKDYTECPKCGEETLAEYSERWFSGGQFTFYFRFVCDCGFDFDVKQQSIPCKVERSDDD